MFVTCTRQCVFYDILVMQESQAYTLCEKEAYEASQVYNSLYIVHFDHFHIIVYQSITLTDDQFIVSVTFQAKKRLIEERIGGLTDLENNC